MSKFAIRLLTLAMYATALVVVPMATASAAADSKQMKKNSNKKKTLNSPSAHDPWSPNHANEDPDRKPAGGGY
jgi:hypothetical protein